MLSEIIRSSGRVSVIMYCAYNLRLSSLTASFLRSVGVIVCDQRLGARPKNNRTRNVKVRLFFTGNCFYRFRLQEHYPDALNGKMVVKVCYVGA